MFTLCNNYCVISVFFVRTVVDFKENNIQDFVRKCANVNSINSIGYDVQV